MRSRHAGRHSAAGRRRPRSAAAVASPSPPSSLFAAPGSDGLPVQDVVVDGSASWLRARSRPASGHARASKKTWAAAALLGERRPAASSSGGGGSRVSDGFVAGAGGGSGPAGGSLATAAAAAASVASGELADDLPGKTLEEFEVCEELGRGAHGVVLKARSLRDGQTYVLKRIDMSRMSERKRREAVGEVLLLRRVRHSSIIRYYGSFIQEGALFIVMEYAGGGDLAAFIRRRRAERDFISERRLWSMLWQLCSALSHLHSRRIIHRDLKPQNVLLTADGALKVGDLGVSRLVSGEESMAHTRVGTPLYLPPEIVRQQPYSYKVDVWGMGCLLYHLSALRPPFAGGNIYTLAKAIVDKRPQPLARFYTKPFARLVMAMLEKVPSRRPTVAQVLRAFPDKLRHALTRHHTTTKRLSSSSSSVSAAAAAPAAAAAGAAAGSEEERGGESDEEDEEEHHDRTRAIRRSRSKWSSSAPAYVALRPLSARAVTVAQFKPGETSMARRSITTGRSRRRTKNKQKKKSVVKAAATMATSSKAAAKPSMRPHSAAADGRRRLAMADEAKCSLEEAKLATTEALPAADSASVLPAPTRQPGSSVWASMHAMRPTHAHGLFASPSPSSAVHSSASPLARSSSAFTGATARTKAAAARVGSTVSFAGGRKQKRRSRPLSAPSHRRRSPLVRPPAELIVVEESDSDADGDDEAEERASRRRGRVAAAVALTKASPSASPFLRPTETMTSTLVRTVSPLRLTSDSYPTAVAAAARSAARSAAPAAAVAAAEAGGSTSAPLAASTTAFARRRRRGQPRDRRRSSRPPRQRPTVADLRAAVVSW